MKTKTYLTIAFALFTTLVNAQVKATVVAVIDGDTYYLKIKSQTTKVRLSNIDAPEIKQAFGPESRTAIVRLLLHKQVVFIPKQTDRYGRSLGQINLGNKRVDSIAVCNGWAWVYRAYCKDKQLIVCEHEAIKAKRGLWRKGVKPVCAPWLYRKLDAKHKRKFMVLTQVTDHKSASTKFSRRSSPTTSTKNADFRRRCFASSCDNTSPQEALRKSAQSAGNIKKLLSVNSVLSVRNSFLCENQHNENSLQLQV